MVRCLQRAPMAARRWERKKSAWFKFAQIRVTPPTKCNGWPRPAPLVLVVCSPGHVLKRTPCGVTTNGLDAAPRQDCYQVLNQVKKSGSGLLSPPSRCPRRTHRVGGRNPRTGPAPDTSVSRFLSFPSRPNFPFAELRIHLFRVHRKMPPHVGTTRIALSERACVCLV